MLALPLAFMFVGAACNQAVLVANGDTFPVLANTVRVEGAPPGTQMDKIHVVMSPEHHLKFLADIFDFQDSTESIGDLMLEFGGWMWGFAPYVWGYAIIRKLNGN